MNPGAIPCPSTPHDLINLEVVEENKGKEGKFWKCRSAGVAA
jgi:hypothetical protein